MAMKPRVYLASPLGFATSTRGFMGEVVVALNQWVEVSNPWDDHRFDHEFAEISRLHEHEERVRRLHAINHELGRGNEERIRTSAALIAVLDGVDVDSGTAAEIGFGYALGMPIFGIRTDFRLAGDNHGAVVNLQVQYFIEESGGRIVGSLEELTSCAAELAAETGGAS